MPERINSIYVQEGDDKARVASSEVAEELAYLEKPARDREIRLEKETKEGVTEKESEMLGLMAGLQEKYPDAFETVITPAGNKILILPKLRVEIGQTITFPFAFSAGSFTQYRAILTKEGMFLPETFLDLAAADFDKLMAFLDSDKFKKDGVAHHVPRECLYKDSEAQKVFVATNFLLHDPVTRAGLKLIFENAQMQGETQSKITEARAKANLKVNILQDL